MNLKIYSKSKRVSENDDNIQFNSIHPFIITSWLNSLLLKKDADK